METMLRILAENPFLKGASSELIETFAHCATSVHFEPGALIMRQGEKTDAGYLVIDGRVGIEVVGDEGEVTPVETARSGDLLGWSWLFPPHRSPFDARTITTVHAVRLGGPCLHDKLEQAPAVGYEAMWRIATLLDDRLQQAQLRLAQRQPLPVR
jgi:CRP/FNR family transcriptional regulator, cyclic AMP receptor protein